MLPKNCRQATAVAIPEQARRVRRTSKSYSTVAAEMGGGPRTWALPSRPI